MGSSPFPIVGFQIDVARRLERPETLYRALEGMGECGYNTCMLYLEDAYDYPRHPKVGRPHAYTVEEMQRAHELCAQQGIELIPCIPALGHASWVTGKPGYDRYDEGRDSGQLMGTLCPSFPETYELIEELFADWCDHIPGKYLHVGLDESPAIGQWAERQGQQVDHVTMFAEHCNRLNAIVRKLGRRMIMWGDMFYYYPHAVERIDKDIIIADWYYYSFPEMPRVEAFNFADIDSTGQLTAAGLEVWGIPSLWPNLPLGDIADRWQNTADWARYGKQKKMAGLLISDWENSWGFCALSDLLYRAFGRLLDEVGKTTPSIYLEQALASEMIRQTGQPACGGLVLDLLALGRHNLTGRADRMFLFSSLATLAIEAREAGCQAHVEAVKELMPAMPRLLSSPGKPKGKILLKAIDLARRLAELGWKQQAQAPAFYRRLVAVAGGGADESLAADMLALAAGTEAFAADYQAHWDEVRFADDPHPTADWCKRSAAELRAWAKALEKGPLAEHPLLATPRLECVFNCRHPSLPVARTTVTWADGTTQETGRAMINFASPYAVPDKAWTEYPSLVLERTELPKSVTIAVNNYGEIGLGEVAVVWQGKRHVYQLVSTSGEYVTKEPGVVWLGPVGATPADPTMRGKADVAVFELA